MKLTDRMDADIENKVKENAVNTEEETKRVLNNFNEYYTGSNN